MITTTTLKNAAFAIEHDLFTDPDGSHYLVKDGAILRRWEPEMSSADAFELMVTLRLQVINDGYMAIARTDHPHRFGSQTSLAVGESMATRISILCCAAQIGESLKCQS